MKSWFFIVALLPACASTLSPEVRRDLESQLAGTHRPIAACYESALQRNDQLTGKVIVRFKVQEQSRAPSAVEVTSSFAMDEELAKCIAAEAEGVRLQEAPEVPIAVTYPIELAVAPAQ